VESFAGVNADHVVRVPQSSRIGSLWAGASGALVVAEPEPTDGMFSLAPASDGSTDRRTREMRTARREHSACQRSSNGASQLVGLPCADASQSVPPPGRLIRAAPGAPRPTETPVSQTRTQAAGTSVHSGRSWCLLPQQVDRAYVRKSDEVDHHIGDLVHDALPQPVIPGGGISSDTSSPTSPGSAISRFFGVWYRCQSRESAKVHERSARSSTSDT
jgi:hypothetical protein